MSSHDDLDLRGNNVDRARRRAWLLSPESGFGGNRIGVNCYHCGRRLTATNMQVDRFPVCGHDGGRYTRDNIVPACALCNGTRCSGCKSVVAARQGLHPREVGYIDTEEPTW